MNSIEAVVDDIRNDLEFFDDELQKYDYIIDLGKKLEALDKDKKNDKNLVDGCTSKVWLDISLEDEKLVLRGTSDAIIVKGLVYIIIQIFSGRSLAELKDFNMDILSRLNLSEIITPSRQSGVAGMINKIMEFSKNGNI